MSFFVTRKTTFGRLTAMQDFVAYPSDPFGRASRWTKLPAGAAEAHETRERRTFSAHDEVHEIVDLS